MPMPPLSPVSIARVSALLVAAAIGLAAAPTAAADPLSPVTGGRSASDVIDELQDQGYDVKINWLTGYDTKPLAECRVSGVNNPGNQPPSEDVLSTVYVDVVCPNGDGGGFTFGGGIG